MRNTLASSMADALGRLCYAADRQLFVVVTADSGYGKSTLIRKFSAALPSESYILLYLSVYSGRVATLGNSNGIYNLGRILF